MALSPVPAAPTRFLVVLGDGGHTAEILRLVELLGPDYEYHYVAAEEDLLSASRLTFPGPLYRVRLPRKKGEPWWRAYQRSVVSLAQALRICAWTRPYVLLGSGPSLMVPLALASRLLRRKVIFIETGSRVTSLSLTGRIMLRLADLFFVQWEQLRPGRRETLFAGRLL